MGREASVQCRWGEDSGLCKVLLETTELIVRGTFRRKVPTSRLRDVSVVGDELRFKVDEDIVSLALGPPLAQQWAKAIATPPPSLAKKLGVSANSRLLVVGDLESPELNAAIADAASTDGKDADLVLISVDTLHDLQLVLTRLARHRPVLTPLWIVYPKGRAFGETSVRETLRERGFIDTKVASVSSKLTALRFIKRNP